LLDHLGIEQVTPIGLSLGGSAAVNFAVLDRVHAAAAT